MLPTVKINQRWDRLQDWMWRSSRFIAEHKKDGGRYLGYKDKSGVRLLSKDRSLDKLGNFPHIRKFLESLPDGTLVDGEISAPSGAFYDVQALLNAAPDKAIERQRETGPALYFVFDVLFFAGKDVRNLSLEERLKLRNSIFRQNAVAEVLPMPNCRENKEAWYLDYIGQGGEGVILKDLKLSYGIGWVKKKYKPDVSVIISALMPDRTSVEISVYDHNEIIGDSLVPVGHCSTNNHELWADITLHPEKYLGQVLDITCLRLQNKSIRSASWGRLRPDIDPKTVTKQKLLKDIKTS